MKNLLLIALKKHKRYAKTCIFAKFGVDLP